MKKSKLLLFLLLAFVAIGCSDGLDNRLLSPQTSSNPESSGNNSLRSSDIVDKPQYSEFELKSISQEYFNNTKSIAAATGALFLSKESIELHKDVINENVSSTHINPIAMKLMSLDITLEDPQFTLGGPPMMKDEPIFYQLPVNERIAFFDTYLQSEVEELTQTLTRAPSMIAAFERENRATTRVLEREGIARLKILPIAMYANEVQHADKIQHADFFRSETRMASEEDLFSKINDEILQEEEAEFKLRSANSYPSATTIGSHPGVYFMVGIGWVKTPKIKPETVRDALAKYSKRGDFLVALPVHGVPEILLNFSNKRFMAGHAGILDKQVTYTTGLETDEVSIEAWNDPKGVQYIKTMQRWDVPFYIMGIQKVKLKWSWKRFWFEKIKTPVSNPGALADWAKKYIGRPYDDTIIFSKWTAPHRFICTSLVWYCSKKAYGINVTNFISPTVTPRTLVMDGNTYIKAEVVR